MMSNDSISQSQLARQRTADDLRHLLQDTEQLIAATRHDSSERLAAVRERVEASVRNVREQFNERERAFAEQARASIQRADHYVHVHPWTSMGLAAGVGMVVGWLMMRR
jgi:ElaB/YqjD/DUF883 family membrane-anchored ribosome-binding protein